MALSGTYYKIPTTGYKLQVEWTADQDIPTNKTTIIQKIYWMSTGSGYTVNSGMTRDGWNEINGSRGAFTANPSLSGNQKKLLDTQTTVVTHNADGTKSVALKANFSPMVTLNGTYFSNIPAETTVTLNTIPRASSLTSSRNWTAGNNLGISISRASSSFDHKIEVIVDGTAIVTRTDIGTSATISFTDAQNTLIFGELVGHTSKPTTVKLTTYNGATQIGSTITYTGTVTAPNATSTASDMSFNIGETIPVTFKRANDQFMHTLRYYVNGSLIKTVTGAETGYTWTPSTAEKTSMYNATSTVKSAQSKIEIDTLYLGKKVRSTTSKTGTATVTASNPTFGTGYTYADTNPTTVELTGSNQYIIQGKSTVQVTIPTAQKAVALNGASIVKYQATIQGITKEVNHHASNNMVFPVHGTLSASTNTTIQVKAIDSRGNSVTTTKTITVIPYTSPAINASAKRDNGFEDNTKLSMNGSISLVNIAGVNKNSIQSIGYRYKLSTETAYPATYTGFTYATSGATYTVTPITLALDNTKVFNIEFMVKDKLGTYTFAVKLGAGKPILFIDGKNNSVGVGKFPSFPSLLDIGGNGHMLSLNGTDHAFMSFYARGTTTRSAYFGFGSGVNTNMNLRSEIGVVSIQGIGSSGGNVPVLIQQEGWISPSFVNGWANYGGGYETAGYRKTSHGTVRLTGLIKGGVATTNNVIFTLPSGYRPPSAIIMGTKNNGGTNVPTSARLTIGSDGQVTYNGSSESTQSTGWVTLSGIEFDLI